jgi:hypothetical protein
MRLCWILIFKSPNEQIILAMPGAVAERRGKSWRASNGDAVTNVKSARLFLPTTYKDYKCATSFPSAITKIDLI